jgi:hypothetical protein
MMNDDWPTLGIFFFFLESFQSPTFNHKRVRGGPEAELEERQKIKHEKRVSEEHRFRSFQRMIERARAEKQNEASRQAQATRSTPIVHIDIVDKESDSSDEDSDSESFHEDSTGIKFENGKPKKVCLSNSEAQETFVTQQ